MIQGSNMAECHPVAFRWPMKAKVQHGAKIIHVDPRFTRTSAMADIHAPIRSGTDIAFLGGLITYVVQNDRWNHEPFFHDYLLHYTNAATIIRDDFADTEDLDGVFSGLMAYKGNPADWPLDGFVGQYDNASWQYRRAQAPHYPGTERIGGAPPTGHAPTGHAPTGTTAPPNVPLADIAKALRVPSPEKDPTLQHPRCVFQIVKRHFSRYTPEMVERVTGCSRATFLKVAETILANSGADRTTAFAYAVAWTQHTDGPQIIGCCALLQLLLGNIGRPGGGILALRGHASIQGSTDIPTLYHSIHGYVEAPSALKNHKTLREFLAATTAPTGVYANTPHFVVSYLKSMYGDAATPENDFGYAWHPRISGDHSHMPMFVAMVEGRVPGLICVGQNPATSLNARLERHGLRTLKWLVVKDNFLTETATFWQHAPEVKSGEIKPEDIGTEVFFFPSSQVAETQGSFTNTQRMLQWHFRAAAAPGQCRSDPWFTYQLGLRLKKLYAGSTLPRDQGFLNLVWDYEPDEPEANTPPGEPDTTKVLREINGYHTGDPSHHLAGFTDIKADGSTTCASWIYCGVLPAPGQNMAARKEPDPPGVVSAELNWGWAWPSNRRVLYNRASADLAGRPWSERKKWVWWDADQKKWVGRDTPDFALTKPPTAPADPHGVGLDALSGTQPFIARPDGVGWLFVPSVLFDGPLPTHYEPAESPIHNVLYRQQSNPVLKYWRHPGNPLATIGDPKYPHVITTYRLTEHYLSGVMSRWNPWLTELMPELFVELSPELAHEIGVANTGWVYVTSPRATIRVRALVTRRVRPFVIDGRVIHQVGMPFHWGYEGVVTGAVANELVSLVGDPNVSIHEGKAFVCRVERG